MVRIPKELLASFAQTKQWFARLRKRSVILLSLYGSSSIVVLAYQAGAWNEWIIGPLDLGYRNESVTVASSIWAALPWSVLLFVVLLLVTGESSQQQATGKFVHTQYYRKMGLTSPAEVAGVINAAALLGLSFVTWYGIGILSDWSQIGYTLVAGIVLGMSTFYLVDSPISESAVFRKSNTDARREALKLQAEFYKELAHVVMLGSIPIFALVLSYFVFRVIQDLPKTKLSLPATNILLFDVLIVTVYFAVGIWGGLVSEFLRRYERTILKMLET